MLFQSAQANAVLPNAAPRLQFAGAGEDRSRHRIAGSHRPLTQQSHRGFAAAKLSHGSLYVSYAQADARDRITGEPIPEAPRLILDAVASANRLPFHLPLRGEYEFVKAKPLGDGFTGVPVTEVRGAVLRPFLEDRMSIAANFLIANGYTGQTTEVLALPTEPAPFERIVGVPLKSYVSLSLTYYFKH